ncbi:LOW QUALITY PROTEIN: hypothetical protein MXB_1225, partial [Myxobolus squamalis]
LVAGPYCYCIFCHHLRCPESCLSKFHPLKDFGGLHPDPNLTYAADFVQNMVTNDYEFGAAFDGDAVFTLFNDRCMIMGNGGYYVAPSDSVAIIAANAVDCIPYFNRKKRLSGLARSMPTSRALDRVAEVLSLSGQELKCFEVPTGWKFFCNLMDAGRIDICGEESFGAGSSHLREKDGIWVALAWLSIMAHHKKSVKDIVEDHWKRFGRHYYTRHDYENLTSSEGDAVMAELEVFIKLELACQNLKVLKHGFFIHEADNFTYYDPIDGSISSRQVLTLRFLHTIRVIVLY